MASKGHRQKQQTQTQQRRGWSSALTSVLSISILFMILSASLTLLLPSLVDSIIFINPESIPIEDLEESTDSIQLPPPLSRQYSPLSSTSLSKVPLLSDPSPILNHHLPTSFLSSILIPRPPESSNNLKVQSLLKSQFEGFKSEWKTEQPQFETQTPIGKKRMSNLIFTLDENAGSKLTLSAHLDSKWFPKGDRLEGFIGATDSASPCAMLVDIAKSLDKPLSKRKRRRDWQFRRWEKEERELELEEDREMEAQMRSLQGKDEELQRREIKDLQETRKRDREEEHEDWIQRNWKRLEREDTTLQMVFFDGEEAYHQWTHEDSIYGSKSLATNWTASSFFPRPLSPRRFTPSSTSRSHMDSIQVLILLDLLGSPNPSIPPYFSPTNWLHDSLISIEKRLKQEGLLYPPRWINSKGKEDTGMGRAKGDSFFRTGSWHGGIEDDHLPFVAAGVPVLHLIPTPFPEVWHKKSDDASALDYPTTYAWSMMFRTLVAEYLGLDLNSVDLRNEVGEGEELRKRSSKEVEEEIWEKEWLAERMNDRQIWEQKKRRRRE